MKPERKKTLKKIVGYKQLYLMLLPFIVYYIVFYYAPMFGLQIAFKDYRPFLGISGSEWVGFEHFKDFFTGAYAWRLIRNTLGINIYYLAVEFVLTIVFAILLNEIAHKKVRTFVQTIMYMPHFISTVVVAGLVVTMLSPSTGIINTLIDMLGGEKTYFLIEPKYFKTIYVVMKTWQSLGFDTIIFTSAICAIDESLYEAARIDGAGRFREIWHITLPGILTTTVLMFIMKIGGILTVDADSILLLYQPVTYETADVISTFVYRVGLVEGNYSYAAAVGMFNSVVALILVVTANKISKKVSDISMW